MAQKAFQDQGSIQHCYGCGADNPQGLQLKSFWDGDEAVAEFVPAHYHCGGAPDIVYGGLIGALIDCHCCNLAVAWGYRAGGREIGSDPRITFVTAQLNVSLLKPTFIKTPLELRARVRETDRKKIWIDCEVTSGGQLTAKGEVLAVRVAVDGAE